MTPVLARAAPLRFLIGVALCWTLARVALLADWSAGTMATPFSARADPPAASSGPVATGRGHVDVPLDPPDPPMPPAAVTSMSVRPDPGPAPANSLGVRVGWDADPILRPMDAMMAEDRAVSAPPGSAGKQGAASKKRWSGSAWAFLRGGGRTGALAPVGQIGGGQAGARLLYRLDEGGRLAASARISRTIGGPHQTEAAIGLDWTPVARIPLHLMAERRIAIDAGGRDAWTLGVAGGVYAVPLGGRWRLDGYGEAGVVGMRRRDLYADGAVRVARAIGLGGEASLALGGGLWAAAQPGAERFDLGPSAVLRMPVARRTMSMALDWRERVSGDARPGSGAALTVAMDF
jgi:hypothetical protein